MQISEIKLINIKKICNYLAKVNIKGIYLDSLGSLILKQSKKIFYLFKKIGVKIWAYTHITI